MTSLPIFPFSKIIAHRGASGYAPENTLIAMRKAHGLGARFVEFDVMLTSDNVPIIMHDITLDRTTSGKGAVAQALYNKITQLDAGNWFDKEYSGEKIPSLTQLLELLAELKMQVNLEIKPTPGTEVITAQQTMQMLATHWYPKKLPILVSSASLISLRTVREMDKQVMIGLISDQWPEDWPNILDELNAVSLHVNHLALTPARVEALKESGKWLLSYTVNELELARRLFDWGVDAVFTDYPDIILRLFN